MTARCRRGDLTYAASAGGEAPGEITYAEAFAVQPFAGSLVSVDLTGAQIEEILEQQFNDSAPGHPPSSWASPRA
ncbi:5'-nucleotidase C-terminal domain-containing protein [Streptomyces vastus]|uniref:5'-nucleotidase C-terminal domain-containing protein n=1 Tax=Streptomyces vastus TaxID=285451 RepID=UPI0031E0BBC9